MVGMSQNSIFKKEIHLEKFGSNNESKFRFIYSDNRQIFIELYIHI